MLYGLQQREIKTRASGIDSDDSLDNGGGTFFFNLLPDGEDGAVIRNGFKKRYTVPGATLIPIRCWPAPASSNVLVVYAKRQHIENAITNCVYDPESKNLLVTFNNLTEQEVLKRYAPNKLLLINYSIEENILENHVVITRINKINEGQYQIYFEPQYLEEREVTVNHLGYYDGVIIEYNFNTPQYNILFEGLSTECSPQALPYNEVLLITNNIEDILVYKYNEQNSSCSFLEQKVKENIELGTSISWSQNQTPNLITFTCHTVQEAQKWATETRCFINGAENKVVGHLLEEKKVTLRFESALNRIPTELFFIRRPPKAKKLFAFHQRILMLTGQTAINAETRPTDMYVYYNNIASDYTTWVNEDTQEYNYENLQIHAIEHDWLEDIVEYGGALYFVGRKKTQIWSWDYEKGVLGGFKEILDSGVYKTGFANKMGGILFFLQSTGFYKMELVALQTHPELRSTTKINNFLKQELTMVTQDRYLNLETCDYRRGGLLFYKISNSRLLVASYKAQLAFSLFESELFTDCTFCVLSESFFLLKGNNVYEYMDGLNGEAPVFTDDNNSISCCWKQPVYGAGLNNWMNYRVVLLLEASELQQDHISKIKIFTKDKLGRKVETKLILKQGNNVLPSWDGTSKDFYFGGVQAFYDTYCKMYFNNITFEFTCVASFYFKIRGLFFLGNQTRALSF